MTPPQADGPMLRQNTRGWEAVRERYRAAVLGRTGLHGRLAEAAAAALSDGKLIRPLLADAAGRALGASGAWIETVGVGVEYLHAASLVLDDLPAMDGADERRGRPAVHAVFSDAEAILLAVALIARTYEMIAAGARPAVAVTASRLVSRAIGGRGMAAGQAAECAGHQADREQILDIHRRKTAALFELAPELLGADPAVDRQSVGRLTDFARLFGEAFQITDDIDDYPVPGERRGNILSAVSEAEARRLAGDRLDAAFRLLRPDDSDGERDLAGLVEWLKGRLHADS